MDELDDLFRQELDGHASEPAADLWARLQARTATSASDADPVDTRFRTGLAGHATPPRRELWERLEDEHLRPRQRRRPVIAWGRLAVAASLLLLVLGGGAGLWWGRQSQSAGPVAATAGRGAAGRPAGPAVGTTTAAASVESKGASTSPLETPRTSGIADNTKKTSLERGSRGFAPGSSLLLASQSASPALTAAPNATARREKTRKISTAQATGRAGSPSSSPVTSTAALRRSAQVPGAKLPIAPAPDAAAGPPTPAVALPQALAVAPPQVIEVEVRRGTAPRPPANTVATAPAPTETAPARRRFRLGGLLREAGHALHGEPVSLAEATGLPESVTVQARLGDRVLARTIRL